MRGTLRRPGFPPAFPFRSCLSDEERPIHCVTTDEKNFYTAWAAGAEGPDGAAPVLSGPAVPKLAVPVAGGAGFGLASEPESLQGRSRGSMREGCEAEMDDAGLEPATPTMSR